jgi:hypothetical protein
MKNNNHFKNKNKYKLTFQVDLLCNLFDKCNGFYFQSSETKQKNESCKPVSKVEWSQQEIYQIVNQHPKRILQMFKSIMEGMGEFSQWHFWKPKSSEKNQLGYITCIWYPQPNKLNSNQNEQLRRELYFEFGHNYFSDSFMPQNLVMPVDVHITTNMLRQVLINYLDTTRGSALDGWMEGDISLLPLMIQYAAKKYHQSSKQIHHFIDQHLHEDILNDVPEVIPRFKSMVLFSSSLKKKKKKS